MTDKPYPKTIFKSKIGKSSSTVDKLSSSFEDACLQGLLPPIGESSPLNPPLLHPSHKTHCPTRPIHPKPSNNNAQKEERKTPRIRRKTSRKTSPSKTKTAQRTRHQTQENRKTTRCCPSPIPSPTLYPASRYRAVCRCDEVITCDAWETRDFCTE